MGILCTDGVMVFDTLDYTFIPKRINKKSNFGMANIALNGRKGLIFS